MTFDYARMRATADRLIGRFGQDAVMVRPGGLNETAYPVVQLPSQRIPCVLVVSSYTAAERGGTLIAEGDVKLMVQATVTPTTADSFEVAGITYRAQAVTELSPGGAVLMYEVRGRAG